MIETKDCLPHKKTINHYLRKLCFGVLNFLYLYIWCRYCYRSVMKIMHIFNLHHTVVYNIKNTIDTDAKNEIIGCRILKKQHMWCQWCGLRGDVIKYEN